MLEFAVLVWHIGDVVRKMREAYVDKATGHCGLSQRELADRAGIRPNTLGDLERNVSNFSRETLHKVTLALNITIEGLYAQLPGVSLPVTTDPVDAETIGRYLQLDPSHRRVVSLLVDTLGHFPDRAVLHHADHAEPTPRSGT